MEAEDRNRVNVRVESTDSFRFISKINVRISIKFKAVVNPDLVVRDKDSFICIFKLMSHLQLSLCNYKLFSVSIKFMVWLLVRI